MNSIMNFMIQLSIFSELSAFELFSFYLIFYAIINHGISLIEKMVDFKRKAMWYDLVVYLFFTIVFVINMQVMIKLALER